MKRLTVLAGSATAVLAAAIGHGAREVSLSDYEKAARGPSPKQQRAQIAKADHADLVTASNRQIVLGHIHPRWLREAVELALDEGIVQVDDAWVARRRAAGPF